MRDDPCRIVSRSWFIPPPYLHFISHQIIFICVDIDKKAIPLYRKLTAGMQSFILEEELANALDAFSYHLR